MILDWIFLGLAHWFTHLEECSLYAMLRIVSMEKTKWEIEDLQQDLKLYRTFTADLICAFCYYQLALRAKFNPILEISVTLISPTGKKKKSRSGSCCLPATILVSCFKLSPYLFTFVLIYSFVSFSSFSYQNWILYLHKLMQWKYSRVDSMLYRIELNKTAHTCKNQFLGPSFISGSLWKTELN